MTSLADRQITEWREAVGKLGRVPDEWIGSGPDAKIPARVLDRVLRTWGCCYLSRLPIAPGTPWEAEHVIPLSMGGQHRESNLRPALAKWHAKKTQQEAAARAKADRARRAHNGTKTPPNAKIPAPPKAPRVSKPAVANVGGIFARIRTLTPDEIAAREETR